MMVKQKENQMEILKNDEPRLGGGRLIRIGYVEDNIVGRCVFGSIKFPLSEQNKGALIDIGYVISNQDDFELELCVPVKMLRDDRNFVELLLNYELWVVILENQNTLTADIYDLYKMKMCKVLYEHFLPIVDGRV